MDANRIRREIVDVVKREYACGMVNMFEGNASARLGDRVFITPSQVSKEAMTTEMVVETDLEGNILYLPEGLKPTSELTMHLAVYRIRPDVRAVIHNHSLYATAFAMCRRPIRSDALTEMNMTFGEVPLIPYGTPGTPAIHAGFEEGLGNYRAVLLENHGVLTMGRTMELAYSYAEGVEKIAQQLLIAEQLGTPVPIPREEAEMLRANASVMRDREIAAALAEDGTE